VEIIAYQEPRFPDRSATLRGSMKMPLLFKPEAKNLSAKLRLREFGQPISATKKLLRWLYPGVRRKVDRVMFGGGGVLQKNQATYVPYGPDAGHHHIAVGKGSDLNVLWHEAGHHKDRESLRKILKSGDVPRWKSELKADNNAEALLRKFGGDVSHYRKMRKTPVGLIKDQGNWINDPVSGYDLSAKLRLRELAAGSLRLVEMGYTKPGLRDRIKARIMASSKGGRPGQWSARKAQLVAQEYRAEGGGYKGGKTESQKSLRKWTREKWGTRSGKPSTQGSEATGERYLPESANKSLSPQEYGATTRAKREGTRRGEQFVRQPERIAKKTANHRS
jgi:hypothetical protein